MSGGVRVKRWTEGTVPSRDYFVEELKGESFSCSDVIYNPGEYTRDHSHQTDEVRVVLSGRMKFSFPQEKLEVELGPGDRLDLEANTVHGARNAGSERAFMLCGSKV